MTAKRTPEEAHDALAYATCPCNPDRDYMLEDCPTLLALREQAEVAREERAVEQPLRPLTSYELSKGGPRVLDRCIAKEGGVSVCYEKAEWCIKHVIERGGEVCEGEHHAAIEAAAERRGEERVRLQVEDKRHQVLEILDARGMSREVSEVILRVLLEVSQPQEQPRIGGQPDGECPHSCLHKECRA